MQECGRKKAAGYVVKKNGFFALLFAFAVIIDQITKFLISSKFEYGQSISLIENILYLHYVKNPGIAFGFSIGSPIIMIILTSLIIILFFYFFLKGKIFSENLIGKTAVMLILGGAVGNLIDRIRFKEVTDFIEMGIGQYKWPIYNFADIFVTFGMIILIYLYSFNSPQNINNP
jgi:signal peptidase II